LQLSLCFWFIINWIPGCMQYLAWVWSPCSYPLPFVR